MRPEGHLRARAGKKSIEHKNGRCPVEKDVLPTRSPESTMSDEERMAAFGWGILLMGVGFPFAYVPFGLSGEEAPGEMVCLMLPFTAIGIAMMVMGARSFWGSLTNKQHLPPVLANMEPARSWRQSPPGGEKGGQEQSTTEIQTTPEMDGAQTGETPAELKAKEGDSFWERMTTPEEG